MTTESDDRGKLGAHIHRTAARVDGLYPLRNRWRVGRKVGRTIYAQIGTQASDDDVLIGVMDTPAIAAEAVRAHNANGAARKTTDESDG